MCNKTGFAFFFCFSLFYFVKMQLQLMHDFWRVSANVILYLCMRNASISIGVLLFSTMKSKKEFKKKKENCWLFCSLLIVVEMNTSLSSVSLFLFVSMCVFFRFDSVSLSLFFLYRKKNVFQRCTDEESQSANKL